MALEGQPGLLRASSSVRELVAAAPFTARDGYLYLGQKRSSVLAVDAVTGTLRSVFRAEHVDFNVDVGAWGESPAVLMVGRTEYTLTAQDRATREVHLNITLAEYAHPAMRLGPDIPGQWSVFEPGQGVVAAGDTLLYGSRATGWQWSRALGSDVVALFLADSAGCLRQVPLDRLQRRPHGGGGPMPSRLTVTEGQHLMQVISFSFVRWYPLLIETGEGMLWIFTSGRGAFPADR